MHIQIYNTNTYVQHISDHFVTIMSISHQCVYIYVCVYVYIMYCIYVCVCICIIIVCMHVNPFLYMHYYCMYMHYYCIYTHRTRLNAESLGGHHYYYHYYYYYVYIYIYILLYYYIFRYRNILYGTCIIYVCMYVCVYIGL